MAYSKMKNLNIYAGIALATLSLPILSEVSGLSKVIGDQAITETRKSHARESTEQGLPNNYEAHYQKNLEVYHASSRAGIDGLMFLIGVAGATNFVNLKRKFNEVFSSK